MSHQTREHGDSVPGPSAAVAIADTVSAIPEEDYKKSVEILKKEWENDKHGALALMAVTYNKRREWISEKADSVHSITEEFPCLKSYDFVSCCCMDAYTSLHVNVLNIRMGGLIPACMLGTSFASSSHNLHCVDTGSYPK